MRRLVQIILIIVVCIVSYFLTYELLSLTSLGEHTVGIISFLSCICVAKIFSLIVKMIVKKEDEEISKTSSKIQKLAELNESYGFKEITKKYRSITEREFSRKSLDRVKGSSVIKYHIENNIDSFRTDIENALYNISLLDAYDKEVEKLVNYESRNDSNYSLKKFKRIERRVFDNLVHKKEDFLIYLDLEIYYRSNSGNINESKRGRYSFDALVELYDEWLHGNKYEETKKQERKIMNDDIRYNVLKRDNFTCQICGATAKDGAKLHVDHIIPVSKGGKTVMSNLQTLCDRCNIGKSNKTGDFDESTICPKCGGTLVKRKSKYGEFIGCSNYPKCRYTR